jgi:hypothetical protein
MEKELTLEEKYKIAIDAIETYLEFYWYSVYADNDDDLNGVDYIKDALKKIDPEKAKQIRAEQKKKAIEDLGEWSINDID